MLNHPTAFALYPLEHLNKRNCVLREVHALRVCFHKGKKEAGQRANQTSSSAPTLQLTNSQFSNPPDLR